jgi:hypothetical protein
MNWHNFVLNPRLVGGFASGTLIVVGLTGKAGMLQVVEGIVVFAVIMLGIPWFPFREPKP